MAYLMATAAVAALMLSAFSGLIAAAMLMRTKKVRHRRKPKTVGEVMSYAEACDALLARRIKRAEELRIDQEKLMRANKRGMGINWGAR